MSRVTVTLVCQWYPPEPTPQPAWIAEGLASLDLDVRVLTGVPNYPTGRVHQGYSAARPIQERIAGVSVNRTPLYPSHDHSAFRRMLNYTSWAVSSTLLGQRLLRWSDAVLVYSSPATAALPAMVARMLWRTPYVLLVQDVWPDSVFASGFLNGRLGRFVRWLLDRFVGASYARSEHILVISPGMIDLLVSRGVPRHKLSLAYNWVDESSRPAPSDAIDLRRELGIPEDGIVVMYAGNHGSAQALHTVVDAFGLPGAAGSHLVMVGDGTEKSALRVRAADNPRVHFVDPQPREAMSEVMAAADAQLVSLADEPLFSVTMPSKVQSILAAGHPAIIVARGDIAEVVRSAGSGLTSAPGSAEDLAQVVGRFARLSSEERRRMGEAGRGYYRRTMSRGVGLAVLERALRRAATDDRRSEANAGIESIVEEG